MRHRRQIGIDAVVPPAPPEEDQAFVEQLEEYSTNEIVLLESVLLANVLVAQKYTMLD